MSQLFLGQDRQPIDKENATPCNSLLKSTREGAIQIAPASEGANAPERPAGKGYTQSYDPCGRTTHPSATTRVDG